MKKHEILVVFLASLAALTCIPAPVRADSPSEPAPIRLRSGLLSGPGDHAGVPERLRLDREQLARGGPALLRLDGPINPRKRAALEAAGIRLAGYLGDRAYVAWLAAGGLELAESLPELEWAAPYHPGLRISPALTNLEAGHRERIPISLHLFAHADPAAVAGKLEALGLSVEGRSAGRARGPSRSYRAGRIVLVPTAQQWSDLAERIAAWPEVVWIDRRPEYRLLNDASAWVGQSGLYADGATPVYDNGIFGDGQTIGVLDTGLDADMCFFRDATLGLPPTNVGLGTGTPDPAQRKVTIVNFLAPGEDPAMPNEWDTHDHGTHVAGSAAGDDLFTPGQRDPADGMAPAAKLVFQDGGYGVDDCADMPAIGCPAADLYPYFEQAYLQGARIHTNSYGDRENLTPYNIYSEGSEAADSFMWDHPDMLLVFAAGNNGPGIDTVASPATGKNVLAVGATNHGSGSDNIASFSSKGLTHDGRYKPDVTTPGSGIISANNDQNVYSFNCGTRSMSGTSMAAPTAAGLAALAGEYYAKGYYPSGSPLPADALSPSAALVKATLIASAVAMEDEGLVPPSTTQGWGRVLLDDALYFSGDSRRLFVADRADRFTSAADPADEFELEVVDSTLPLRVVLAWTDYPSTPAASINLVNNLDLEVESPSGEIYRGNVFVGGSSVTGGSADGVNNVEATRIESPQAGVWTLRVIPGDIPESPQGYALVATGRMPATNVHLEQVSVTLDDSVGGNGDGHLDPGEWADVTVELINSGGIAATNVGVALTSLSPGLEVHIPTGPLPDILAGQTGSGETPRPRIRLAADHPCTDPVSLHYIYSADGYARGEIGALETGQTVIIAYEDFEGATSWQHQPQESTATTGDWVVFDPLGTNYQPEDDATADPGDRCLFTAVNVSADSLDDVDDGVVVARSGDYDLSGHPEAWLRISRWFGNRDTGEDIEDYFRLEIRGGPAAPDLLLDELDTFQSEPRWTELTFRVADYVTPGPQVQLKVSASDGVGPASIIEAAIDEIVFWEATCQPYNPAPNPVDSLRLFRSGGDAELSWSRPDLDPDHGEADRYRVYRSDAPDAGWGQLQELLDPATEVQYTDVGGGTGPGLRFYQIVAGNDAGDAEPAP